MRVLIRTRDEKEARSTVGVSDNILEASFQALSDAINYKLNMLNMKSKKAEGKIRKFESEEALA